MVTSFRIFLVPSELKISNGARGPDRAMAGRPAASLDFDHVHFERVAAFGSGVVLDGESFRANLLTGRKDDQLAGVRLSFLCGSYQAEAAEEERG